MPIGKGKGVLEGSIFELNSPDSLSHDCQGISYRSRTAVARGLGLDVATATENIVLPKTGKAPSARSRGRPLTSKRDASELQAREVVSAASQLLPEGIVPQHGKGNLAWECQVCGQVGK